MCLEYKHAGDTFAENPNIMPIGESTNRFSVKLYLFMGYG